jgi:hypothetical protein
MHAGHKLKIPKPQNQQVENEKGKNGSENQDRTSNQIRKKQPTDTLTQTKTAAAYY